MHQRLALLGTTLALSVPVGLAAAAPASAASYPSSVQKQFLTACTKAAKGEKVSSSQARSYCKASLKCLQRELTLKQFKKYDTAVSRGDKTPPYSKVIKGCVKEAAGKL